MPAKPFVYFWETVTSKERAKERADYVLRPIHDYRKNARRILEIGCGIGEVLANFPEKYEIYGLDIKKDYIDVCRRRIPKGTFLVSSMHNFKIDRKFDVIFSADDAINFLETFTQWKSTFQSVNDHLSEDGLFIFDIYTPEMLTSEKGKGPTFRSISKGYYYDKGVVSSARALSIEVLCLFKACFHNNTGQNKKSRN